MTRSSSSENGSPSAKLPDKTWHRGIDRDTVVTTALRILDSEGRAALTMRRLATALAIEAPSLYVHVRSKDDLIDDVLDRVLTSIPLPPLDLDVRDALMTGFTGYRRALVAHPAVVPMIAERGRTSAAQIRLIERSIELLERAGLSTHAAVDVHVTLVAYVLGFVLQEVGRPTGPSAALDGAGPTIRRVFATLSERTVAERFEAGLALILDGIGSRTRRDI